LLYFVQTVTKKLSVSLCVFVRHGMLLLRGHHSTCGLCWRLDESATAEQT
jgi:hypothetical protein